MSTGLSLTEDETRLLSVYEGVIKSGLESFVEVGNALMRIRDSRLYRDEFDTFEDYCRTRWSLSKTHVNRLVQASEVVDDVTPIGVKPQTESQARPLASVPKEDRADVWQQVVESAPKDDEGEPQITAKHVEQVVAKVLDKPTPHVAHNSGNNEWYTPPEIIEAARGVLKTIDCDPASSEVANTVVKAKRFYSADNCGLKAAEWGKRVWMNPPYEQPLCAQFCGSLAERISRGEVVEACVLVNNATETAWFQNLALNAAAVVFLAGRVKFLDATGQPKGQPLQGQAVLYFGERLTAFIEAFDGMGWRAIVQ